MHRLAVSCLYLYRVQCTSFASVHRLGLGAAQEGRNVTGTKRWYSAGHIWLLPCTMFVGFHVSCARPCQHEIWQAAGGCSCTGTVLHMEGC